MNTKHVIATIVFASMATAIPTVVSAQQTDSSMPGMQHAAKTADAQGMGVVKAIDTNKNTITLQHDAIASLGWPAMTMAFKVASPDLLKAAKVGDQVHFTLRPAGMDSTLTSIQPMSH